MSGLPILLIEVVLYCSLICIFLIISDVKHLLVYPLPILLLTCYGFEEQKLYEKKFSSSVTIGQMLAITCKVTGLVLFVCLVV